MTGNKTDVSRQHGSQNINRRLGHNKAVGLSIKNHINRNLLAKSNDNKVKRPFERERQLSKVDKIEGNVRKLKYQLGLLEKKLIESHFQYGNLALSVERLRADVKRMNENVGKLVSDMHPKPHKTGRERGFRKIGGIQIVDTKTLLQRNY